MTGTGRTIAALAALGLLGLGAAWVLTAPERVDPELLADLVGDADRGETVFWAGGCASCHAVPQAAGEDRLILAGGQAFPSEFGTFRAPNISSDPDVGIGDWTLAEFVDALQNGVSPDGRHYYPAFPYTAYRLAEHQDLADLFAFMGTLPASDTPSEPHDVSFPFSIRRLVGGWNLLFLQDEFVVGGDLPLSDETTRGRYLAEALGHCAECHTPRNELGALDRDRWLQGAANPTGDGRIPGLTPSQLSWSAEEIAAYLADGFTPEFDSAGGHMASVVQNLARLSDADRQAIAAYLAALPAAETP